MTSPERRKKEISNYLWSLFSRLGMIDSFSSEGQELTRQITRINAALQENNNEEIINIYYEYIF